MSSIKKIRTTEGDLSIDYNSLDNLPTIPSKVSDLTNDSGFITSSVNNLTNYYTKTSIDSSLGSKQDSLVSGTNIKTINNESILGSGNITISAASVNDSYSTSTTEPYSSNYVNSLNTYSTTEEVKIGTWIDGKPLYRIVASINLQDYTSWTNLVHISNLKRVINIYGSLNNINIPRYESPSYFTQFLYENNYIKVMCNGNTGDGYLVIEYTKTTD